MVGLFDSMDVSVHVETQTLMRVMAEVEGMVSVGSYHTELVVVDMENT